MIPPKRDAGDLPAPPAAPGTPPRFSPSRLLGRPGLERSFANATLVVVPAYLLWRGAFTLNPDWPVASWLMLIADAMFGLSALGFALTRLRGDGDAAPAPPPAPGLSVDVWITTYNEDLALLRRTVQHAVKMDYPHTTYVLDDGAREEVRALCDQLGARYLSRSDRSNGKAGNLNHALAQTTGDLIATFDADFVPQRDFLTRLLGHLADPSVALVQTPQRYYNVDSFQHDRRPRATWDEQEVFFDLTMPGLAAWGSAYWVGTNALLRRQALVDIGGFPTDSLIEDMLTGMLLHAKGYTSVYVQENLAHGLAPAFASQFLTQRLRWAQGAFQILRRHNPLIKAGLRPMQRVLYFTSLFHFAEGLPRVIFYAAPALFVGFGVAPLRLSAGVALGIGAYLLFSVAAAKALSRGRLRLLRSELFAMIRYFPYLRAALALLDGRPRRFVVTGKGGSRDQNAPGLGHLVGPALVLILNLGAAVVGLLLLPHVGGVDDAAPRIALALCVAFSLAYAALAGWALRWCYTGPRVAGLAFFDWLPLDLTPPGGPAAPERCIAHRWSDERVVFRSQGAHAVGDRVALRLNLSAEEGIDVGARIDARSRVRGPFGAYEVEAAFEPLPDPVKARLIEAVYCQAVQRQALEGSVAGPVFLGEGAGAPPHALAVGARIAKDRMWVESQAPLGPRVRVQLPSTEILTGAPLKSEAIPGGPIRTLLALDPRPSALVSGVRGLFSDRPRRLDLARFGTLALLTLALGMGIGASLTPAGLRPLWVRDSLRLTAQRSRAIVAAAHEAPLYSTRGTDILGPDGQPLPTLHGIAWFGLESPTHVPHGLWARPMDEVLDQVKHLGFNLIRVPFSTAALHTADTQSVSFSANPDLVGLTPIEVLDQLVERAAERGLYIILDRHSLDERDHRIDDLWYSAAYPEAMLIADWRMLAQRYKGIPQILGADIHNEPKGMATWGTNDPATDWRLAAERIGDSILEVNPDWLIFVEGVSAPWGCGPNGYDVVSECYWDGGNLSRVRTHPVRLEVPNKVVYSPHDYGPGLFQQPWHDDPWFPENLTAIWEKNWAFIHLEGLAPVLLGEFGGPGIDETTQDGQWKLALVAYLKKNKLSWSYWTLNPNSPDTKGLLEDDWKTVNLGRYAVLYDLMATPVPPESATPAGAAPGEVLCMAAPGGEGPVLMP